MTSTKRPAFILLLKMMTLTLGLGLIVDALFRPTTSYVSVDTGKYFLVVTITALALSSLTFLASACTAFPGSVIWRRIDIGYHALMGIAIASGSIPVIVRVVNDVDDKENGEFPEHVYIGRLCGTALGLVNAVLYGATSIAIYKS